MAHLTRNGRKINITELNSNFKGNVSELQCILAFTELGYQVSLPFGGQARYDFIADVNNKLIRVQVKTAKRVSEESFMIECRNSHYLQGHHTHSKYDKDEIDYFATFCNGKCYLIHINDCGSTKTLRFNLPANGIVSTINLAKDYEIQEVIKTI